MKKQLLYTLVFLLSIQFGFSTSKNNTALLCPAPTNLTVSSVTFNSLVLSWTNNAAVTSTHILAWPAAAAAPNSSSAGYFAATTNPTQIFTLAANTNYKIYARSVCSTGEWSDWSDPVLVTTTGIPPSCGGTFTDQAGPTANYAHNSDNIISICPTIPGQGVIINFSSFSTEAGHDALYVYNGASTASPLIPSSNPAGSVPNGGPGGYWGDTIPGPFISTAANGCLTFRFKSDGANSFPGWVASVVCAPLGCYSVPTNVTVSNAFNNSATLTWNTGNSNFWEVLVLPYGTEPTATSMGLPAFSSPYQITDLDGGCYSAYIRSKCQPGSIFSSPWSSAINFCGQNCENNADCPEHLNLIAFLDSNNNGIKDLGENNFNHGSFVYQINSGPSIVGATNTSGFMIFDSNPANSYHLDFDVHVPLQPYFNSAATFSNVTLPSGSGSNTYYFPVTQLQPYNDLEIKIVPLNVPRPGFHYSNLLIYKNKGLQNVASGTVTFTKDPAVTITYVTESGITSSPTGFSYNFTNLAPNELRIIGVEMLVPAPPTVNSGDVLTNHAAVNPIVGDAFPADNNDVLSQTVVNAFDPNDKMESHGGRIPINTFTANDYLTYTIRFENVGTASAEFIRIEDELSSLLNAGSVQVLNASHPYNFRRINNKLIWNFYNINLPPTATNPTQSHGYVQFMVKPNAGYSVGTIIPNSAEIYFDYNFPIYTGIFNTEFVAALATSDFNTGNFVISPNPATDHVNIQLQNTSETITNVTVTDILGKVIRQISNNSNNLVQVDVSDFSQGIYFVEATTSSNLKQVKKLVIE